MAVIKLFYQILFYSFSAQLYVAVAQLWVAMPVVFKKGFDKVKSPWKMK